MSEPEILEAPAKQSLTADVVRVELAIVITSPCKRCGTKLATPDGRLAQLIERGGTAEAACPGCGEPSLISQGRVIA